MSQQKIRIKLKSYDHRLIDDAAKKIISVIQKSAAKVSGPIPLPTERTVYTVTRSPHVDKNSREQFEKKIHKRLIDIINPGQKTVDDLIKITIPAGVDVEIKL
jgi:small subunit ribosomal protein S10